MSSVPTRAQRLETLTSANIDDLLRAVGLPPTAGRLLRPVLWPPARRFARQVVHLDDLVSTHSLARGARWAIEHFTADLAVHGQEHLPASGPLLVVSNHPGMVDAMAVVIALGGRRDVRIIAEHRDFLTSLPAISSHLLWVDPHSGARSEMVRRATAHLAGGGCVLTFPAGTIEPDPTVRPGAIEALDAWSRSTEILARRVAGLTIVPVAVSGTISASARRTWLARRRHDPLDQEWAAASLQVISRRYRTTHTHVDIGEPTTADRVPEVMARLLGTAAQRAGRGADHA